MCKVIVQNVMFPHTMHESTQTESKHNSNIKSWNCTIHSLRPRWWIKAQGSLGILEVLRLTFFARGTNLLTLTVVELILYAVLSTTEKNVINVCCTRTTYIHPQNKRNLATSINTKNLHQAPPPPRRRSPNNNHTKQNNLTKLRLLPLSHSRRFPRSVVGQNPLNLKVTWLYSSRLTHKE